jgi:hypothetical protein
MVTENGSAPDVLQLRRRKALRVAGLLLGLQAIAAVGYGILVMTRVNHVAAGVGYGVAGMMIVWGLAFGLIGRGVWLARRWARGAAVALQLLNLPLAWGFRTNFGWLALAMFATSVAVLICLFLPSSTVAFTAERDLPLSRR